MNKDEWVNEVMNSINGMERLLPHEGLYNNIIAWLDKKRGTASLPVIRWSVAAAILLFILNFGSIVLCTSGDRRPGNDINRERGQVELEIQNGSTYNY